MPFTPFHLGPALLLGLLCYRWLDLPALLVGSVVVDVRTALVFFGYLDPPLHGPLHTVIGSAVLGLVVAGAWVALRPRFEWLLALLGLGRERSIGAIFTGAFVAVWLHLLLDALLYFDLRPFAPLSDVNPFLWALGGPRTFVVVYGGCVVAGVLGLLLYGYRRLGADRRLGPVA